MKTLTKKIITLSALALTSSLTFANDLRFNGNIAVFDKNGKKIADNANFINNPTNRPIDALIPFKFENKVYNLYIEKEGVKEYGDLFYTSPDCIGPAYMDGEETLVAVSAVHNRKLYVPETFEALPETLASHSIVTQPPIGDGITKMCINTTFTLGVVPAKIIIENVDEAIPGPFTTKLRKNKIRRLKKQINELKAQINQ